MLKRVLMAAAVIFGTALAWRFALQTAHGKRRVDALEEWTIGGIPQWVLHRAQDPARPPLLYVQGGPGLPMFPFVPALGATARLEDDFAVTWWEARGTGKSYRGGMALSLPLLAGDICELLGRVSQRSAGRKVYLMAHSWGTIPAFQAAVRCPQLVQAYVGIGQVVNWREGYRISTAWAIEQARKARNRKAVAELEGIGMTMEERYRQRRWVVEYGGFEKTRAARSLQARATLGMLTSPYYSLADLFRIASDPYFAPRALAQETAEVDFFTQIPEVPVPAYFLEGRHDYTIPSELADRYYYQLRAPKGKHLIWFAESAHMPQFEEPAEFHRIVQLRILGGR